MTNNLDDDNRPMTAPGLSWWLFRVVINDGANPGAPPRVLFVVGVHMAGAIETAVRTLGGKFSLVDVAACDRSAPVNCITSSVYNDMRMRQAEMVARAS